MSAKISIAVAIGRDRNHNHVIGCKNELLWPISDDLKRFKSLTMGHPVIMGRKTFESILARLGKPLPGRTNIILTRDATWTHDGVEAFPSLEKAISRAREIDQTEIFIGGGTEVYRQALPYVDKLYVTYIDDEKEGDSFFPPFENEFTKEVSREERITPEGLRYTWVDLERP